MTYELSKDRFTSGSWTARNPERDPCGELTKETLDPARKVEDSASTSLSQPDTSESALQFERTSFDLQDLQSPGLKRPDQLTAELLLGVC